MSRARPNELASETRLRRDASRAATCTGYMTVSTPSPMHAHAQAGARTGRQPRQRGDGRRAASPCSRRAIRRAAPVIRELRPDDGTILDEVFAGLSERSRYLRFHSPLHRLSDRFRATLLDVDGRDRLALVALVCTPDGPRPVGIVRLSRTGPGDADIAIAVADAMHRQGVGRQLLTALGDRAAELGLTRLTAEILPENTAAAALFRAVFPHGPTRRGGGILTLTCHPAEGAHHSS
ncbi:GCN5-related N-acetyltransferase [Pseudofrankia inefficax]|uniref:GCN5-related N-acetyltransferase n=1 Tax=Pseudofrankia inefficax (strain DSM 45817 / CECT 9037 / DDB 130130 / EuI1c) TaxID=298654 RepID=E3J6S7_PSEI1|nr:GCN5-related N-acetyltransferase [Pseudofrankia inefficax]